MTILLSILFGVVVGWYLRQMVAIYRITRYMKIAEAITKEDDGYTKVKIEKHNDALYVFELETDKFLCQGANTTEIIENLKKMYPNKGFKAFTDDVPEGIEK